MADIFVIGGVCADISGFPMGSIAERDSNPSRITVKTGGVGFNIARRLALLGHRVAMACALGDDPFADIIRKEAEKRGVELVCIPAERSGVYLCVNDENGDMRFAFSDLSGTEEGITPEAALGLMKSVNASDACIIDGNLTAETIAFIARNAKAPIFADPVSAKKAMRFLPVLDRLYAIKPNELEAAAMTGLDEPCACARELVRRGCKAAFVSCGEAGMCFACADEAGAAEASPAEGVTTGAGDAAFAMLIHSLLAGFGARQAAERANAFAAEAIIHNDRK